MRKKSLLWIFLLPIVLHLFHLFVLHFGEKFNPYDFEHGFKQNCLANISKLDFSKLDSILLQPFHYLGHGKQMTAFESEDGKYVLKLFNPMRPLKRGWYKQWKFWKRYSSLKWISREWFQKRARLKKLFKRHKIAYKKLRSETGLLFVHLAPSQKICHYLQLIDNRGKKHIVPLASTPFVLQEKAILVPQHLHHLIQSGQIESAKQAIVSLERLFEKRLEEGITDRIQTMDNNYGFVGEKPIQIDVGRIRIEEEIKINPDSERKRILNTFHQWLGSRFPELKPGLYEKPLVEREKGR